MAIMTMRDAIETVWRGAPLSTKRIPIFTAQVCFGCPRQDVIARGEYDECGKLLSTVAPFLGKRQ